MYLKKGWAFGVILVVSGCSGVPLQEGAQSEISPSSALNLPPPIPSELLSPSKLPSNGNERSILQNQALSTSHLGYILMDPKTGKVLSEWNSKETFNPASVTKVMSTVAALKILGPQYRFKTELLYSGKVLNHTLVGDLYLRGEGDPLLTTAQIMSLVEHLRAKEIHRIKGRFYFDDTFLISQSAIDPLRDEFENYNPGVSALSAEYNQKKEAFSTFFAGLSGYSNAESQKGPIKSPAYFTASFLKRLAQFQGLKLPEPRFKKTPVKGHLLISLPSLPLIDLSEKVLEYSNNLMAELIQLAAARKLSGKPVSIPSASFLISHWIRRWMPKSVWKGLVLQNGSGLGALNQFTPEQVARVLQYADRQNFGQRSYLSLLPISGLKGSLSRRMEGPDSVMRVWAKTGSQRFCNSLGGYVFTQSGRKLVFAILGTDSVQRKRFEVQSMTARIPTSQAEDTQGVVEKGEALRWTKKVQATQEQLLMYWIRKY